MTKDSNRPLPAGRPEGCGAIGCAVVGLLLLAGSARAQSALQSRGDEEISLAEAVTRALSNNLELQAMRADTGLAAAQLIGSRLRPNPALAVEYQSTGERPGAGLEAEATVSLTQDLELWGVRKQRIRAASLEVDRSRYQALDAARLVHREVAGLYRELLFEQERAVLLDSLARVNGRVTHAAQIAFEQGFGSELDTRLSQGAWQRSLLDRDEALRQYRITQLEFAKLLGDSVTATYRLTDSLPAAGLPLLTVHLAAVSTGEDGRFEAVAPAIDSLLQLAMAQRPDVRAAEYDLEARQATLAAARAAGKPTVAIGALYSRARDNFTLGTQEGSDLDSAFGLGLVIGLPLFNRNQGEVASARFAAEAAALRLANTRQRVEADVRVAVQRAELAASKVETLRRTILPTDASALRIVEVAFGRGQADIFQVLQVQRAYFETTTGLLEALRQYAAALAELEAAVGIPLE